MKDNSKLINRIFYSVDKNQFDDDILDIIIKPVCFQKNHRRLHANYLKLNKIETVNNINIYESLCNTSWDPSTSIIIIFSKSFHYLLKGTGEIRVIEDDIGCNYVNDLCGDICHPKNYELKYNVYNNFFKKSAITLFVDRLKYPELVLLVLFEFLKINYYPQDLKNCILLLYNDVC